MKIYSVLTLLFLFVWSAMFGQNISTGIDSLGNPLPLNTIDPYWIMVNSPVLPDTQAQTCTYYSGYWQATPIAGTGANWINHSGSPYGGTVAGDYTFERRFEVTEDVCAFICNFGLTSDDSIISLALVAPNLATLPLTFVASNGWYQLSDSIGDTIFNPQVGTWKVRAMINFYDAAAGFLLSGSIDTLQCASPLPLCDSNLVANGNFDLGFHSNNDGGSFTGCNTTGPGSYATDWCGVGNPQYVFFPNSNSYGITMWGIGQDFQTGEGITQDIPFLKWWGYQVRFDGVLRNVATTISDTLMVRFTAYNTVPTVVNQAGGTVIGEQMVTDTNWANYALPVWYAPDTNQHLMVSIHNFSSLNNGAYACWAGIDNICIQRGQYVGVSQGRSAETKLDVFPNPVNSTLSMRLPESLEGIESIQVLDMLGRKVEFKVIAEEDRLLRLDVSSLPRGSYFLHVRAQASALPYSAKFLKD